MRYIRSALRPGNGRLGHHFQQCELIKTVNARLCPGSIEESNLVHESNIQCRARSYAASDPSDMPEARKTKKRVTKDKRKSMVENYVNKYRELNGGKFPGAVDARKSVGGSYYIVREILQELKYNFKRSSVDSKDANSLDRSSVKKDEISSHSQEVSQTRKKENLSTPLDIRDSSSMSSETKEGSQSSILVETPSNEETQLLSAVGESSKDVGTPSHHLSDEPDSQHIHPENNVKQKTIHEDKLKFDGLQHKAEPHESTEPQEHEAEPQESTEPEVSGREMHKVPSKDEEPQRKSSVWQNLKSFASGFFGSWRS